MLETIDGDYFFIEPPPLIGSTTRESNAITRLYHLELLQRVRSHANWELVASDKPLFNVFGFHYQKVADCLHPEFDCKLLKPESRHRFFIASAQDPRISGLELLMGYTIADTETKEPDLNITSGNYEIDVLGELLLINNPNLEWIAREKSPVYILKLAKYCNDRLRGQQALDDLQTQKDLAKLNDSQVEEKFARMGLKL